MFGERNESFPPQSVAALMGTEIFIRNHRQSEEESVGDTWIIPVTPGLEHRPGRQGWGGAEEPHSNTYNRRGFHPSPIQFVQPGPGNSLFWLYCKGFVGSSWFQDEPHLEQVEKPVRAVINWDLCS